jgi:hypothetical protein
MTDAHVPPRYAHLPHPITMHRPFQVCTPSTDDAGRIAWIHLAAMNKNPLLHVQFPTAASLEKLEHFLQAYTISELKNPKVGILVARYVDDSPVLSTRDDTPDCVVSFAKWDYPSSGGGEDETKLETGDLRNLEGCRREYLEQYAALAEDAMKRSFGDRPCYRESGPSCCVLKMLTQTACYH